MWNNSGKANSPGCRYMSVSKILGWLGVSFDLWAGAKYLSFQQLILWKRGEEDRSLRASRNGFMSKETIKMGSSVDGMRWEGGILWVQLLLQFSSMFFETLQMFCSWSEDVHAVWKLLSKNVWLLFSHFSTYQMQWRRNFVSASPFTVLVRSLKFCRYFVHGLKILM